MAEDWRDILNGEEPKKEQPKEEVNEAEKYNLASGVYKFCRLGDVENALKYAEKLRRMTGDFYIMRILTQLIGEDLCPNEYNKLAPTIRTIYQAAKANDLRGHDIWQCVYLVANAKKWYQTKEGIELEKIRHKVNKNNPVIDIQDYPWLYDFHTIEGRRRIGLGTADLRMDGRWENRFNVLKRWEGILNSSENFEEARRRWIESHK